MDIESIKWNIANNPRLEELESRLSNVLERLGLTNHAATADMRDKLDAEREELAWRAFCSATISDPSKIDKKIRSAVKKAFKSYPPRVRP